MRFQIGVIPFRYVNSDTQRLHSAFVVDFRSRRADLTLRSGKHRHVHAFQCQRTRNSVTDAFAGAADYDDCCSGSLGPKLVLDL
jgi:hypothetical protein